MMQITIITAPRTTVFIRPSLAHRKPATKKPLTNPIEYRLIRRPIAAVDSNSDTWIAGISAMISC